MTTRSEYAPKRNKLHNLKENFGHHASNQPEQACGYKYFYIKKIPKYAPIQL